MFDVADIIVLDMIVNGRRGYDPVVKGQPRSPSRAGRGHLVGCSSG